MQVFVILGQGLGDDEDNWEIVTVRLSKDAADAEVVRLQQEMTGCSIRYEEHTAT